MMRRVLSALLLLTLAACASHAPVPVADDRDARRIEPALPGKTAAAAGKMVTVKKGDTLYSIAREQGVDPRELAAWNNIDSTARIGVGQKLRVSSPLVADVSVPHAVAGAEVRPIASGGPVVARSLDDAPLAVQPAPTPLLSPENSDKLKRTPKGGKLPYSEENLALLKAREAGMPAPATSSAISAAAVAPANPAAPVTPAAAPAAGDIEWAWPATGKLLANFSEGGNGGESYKGIAIAGKIGDPVQAAAAGKIIYVGVFPKHGNLVVVLHAGGYSSVYAHNSRIIVKDGQMVTRGQKIAELGNSDAEQPKLHFEVRQQGKPLDPLRFLPKR